MQQIKLGIIGVGNMGRVHYLNILEGKCPDFIVTAIADHQQLKRDWAQQQDENLTVFIDGMELIESGLCDAVIVAVPHYEHPSLSMAAMQRGMHVMCEKPAGVYTKQVREMNAMADQCDVVFGMMFNQRTNPTYIKMRELVQSGKYGQIRRVNWLITTWFRSQYYYDSGDWRATWSGEGGGVLLNQCPHQLDLLQWICGMPSTVQAHLHYGKWHDIEVEDDVTAYLEYPNGATGVFITSTGDGHGANRLEIQLDGARLIATEDGLDVLEFDESMTTFMTSTTDAFAKVSAHPVDLSDDTVETAHAGVLCAFGNKILGKGELIATGQEGINGLTLSNAMHLSSFTNQAVSLPFDEEMFYQELMKRVATSKRKQVVAPTKMTDLSGSY